MSPTEKFPKKMRFTLSNRIDSMALDLLEKLIEAKYTRNRKAILDRANLILDKLRMLMRLSHNLGYLPHRQYEHSARELDTIGRMIGAWNKRGA